MERRRIERDRRHFSSGRSTRRAGALAEPCRFHGFSWSGCARDLAEWSGGPGARDVADNPGSRERTAAFELRRSVLDYRGCAARLPGRTDCRGAACQAKNERLCFGFRIDPPRVCGLGDSLRATFARRFFVCNMECANKKLILRAGSFWNPALLLRAAR